MADSETLPLSGDWQCPTKLGGAYIWFDSTDDVLRIREDGRLPTHEGDGVAIVTGDRD